MAKSELGMSLINIVKENQNADSKEFVTLINPIIVEVELNEVMKTSKKLKIFSLFTMLSNCDNKQRMKYAKKISRLL